jgi:hypothetical protein
VVLAEPRRVALEDPRLAIGVAPFSLEVVEWHDEVGVVSNG